MTAIKTSGQVSSTISAARASADKKTITETSACLLVGTRISTGAMFYRTFPSVAAMTQWLTTGDGNDIDVQRVDPITVFTA